MASKTMDEAIRRAMKELGPPKGITVCPRGGGNICNSRSMTKDQVLLSSQDDELVDVCKHLQEILRGGCFLH